TVHQCPLRGRPPWDQGVVDEIPVHLRLCGLVSNPNTVSPAGEEPPVVDDIVHVVETADIGADLWVTLSVLRVHVVVHRDPLPDLVGVVRNRRRMKVVEDEAPRKRQVPDLAPDVWPAIRGSPGGDVV